MILKVINHDFIYEMSHLCTVFFPFEKIKDDGEDNIEVVTSANGNEFSVYARVYDKFRAAPLGRKQKHSGML